MVPIFANDDGAGWHNRCKVKIAQSRQGSSEAPHRSLTSDTSVYVLPPASHGGSVRTVTLDLKLNTSAGASMCITRQRMRT